MREIKFRGICEQSKKFKYGYVFRPFDIESKYMGIIPDNGFSHSFVIKETVGQFTGLKDVQGVDIYDGDILEDEEHNRREVYWSSDNLAWYCTNYFCSLSEVAGECKVIGNFYQNSELLED